MVSVARRLQESCIYYKSRVYTASDKLVSRMAPHAVVLGDSPGSESQRRVLTTIHCLLHSLLLLSTTITKHGHCRVTVVGNCPQSQGSPLFLVDLFINGIFIVLISLMDVMFIILLTTPAREILPYFWLEADFLLLWLYQPRDISLKRFLHVYFDCDWSYASDISN